MDADISEFITWLKSESFESALDVLKGSKLAKNQFVQFIQSSVQRLSGDSNVMNDDDAQSYTKHLFETVRWPPLK